MGIGTNLKSLRIKNGFTQEQIAGKLHVTRQAISSYEAGRTQPDVDTIKKFADIYKVDVSDIVYDIKTVAPKSFIIVAIVHYGLQILLDAAMSGLLLYENLRYPMPIGIVSAEQMAILEKHRQLSSCVIQIENIMLAECFLGSVLLLGWVITRRYPIHTRKYCRYCVSLVCVLLLIPFVCAAFDPIFLLANYIFTPGTSAVVTTVALAVLLRTKR